ncbi:MAG: amidohydrolase family protein [Chloroflexi bacterium]|nr:amidohydrolase family protein [Chloroflexota bacterium]
MAFNGWTIIDMDSHVREDPASMFGDYIDAEYKEKFDRLKLALDQSKEKGTGGQVASSRTAIVAPIISDNPLGDRDGFGLTGREFILLNTSGRRNFGRPNGSELKAIDQSVSWDVKARLRGMDESFIDIDVIYPTHVSSYCALNDVGFESALYRAYHRWIHDFCAQAPDRLKWTLVTNMRDPQETCAEVKRWVEDQTMVGIYMPPNGPDNMLLDDPTLLPVYGLAQELDLPILIHGGTARPPYQPGTFDLQGTWFLQHGLLNPWAGMASMGAIVGGGILERFPKLRVAVVETAAGWLPAILDRFDSHYIMSPGHVPYLKQMPSEVIKNSGQYFHGIDTWESTLEDVVKHVGEDMLLFATDWPHGDTAWPQAVQQVMEWDGLSDTVKQKIFAGNAMRLCPRLQV